MSERGTPKKTELQQRLDGIGIPVHSGGFSNASPDNGDRYPLTPVLAIWHESAVPTPDEVATIKSSAEARLSRFGPSLVEGLAARGVTTVVLCKMEDGTWKSIRMGLDPKLWSKTDTLEQIIKEEL